MCDAANSNMSMMFNVIEKSMAPDTNGRLPKKATGLRNWADQSKWIFLLPCGAHELKNTRNQLWKSKLEKDSHLRRNGKDLSWDHVHEVYEKHCMNPDSPLKVPSKAVHLDNFKRG